MQLTKNFTLEELCRSEVATRRDIKNNPNAEQLDALRLLATNVLQPIRNRFGPIRITSGFRSNMVNLLVGGSTSSDHCKGMAADIECDAVSNLELAEWVRENLAYKQLILEFPPDGWVHVSFDPMNNKREVLTAFRKANKTVYNSGLLSSRA